MLANRKTVSAHRLSYEVHKGAIPSGMMVRHTCDNKLCVAPDHLILGTAKDNAADAAERGLAPRGEANGKTRLTEGQVREIRSDTRTLHAIAADYGVSHSTVWNIKKRVTWKHI